MSSVGIIVNPFSGKDLRRLTASAANVNNMDKADKVIRIVHCMQGSVVDRVYLMPDNYSVNDYIARKVNTGGVGILAEVLDFRASDNYEDTLEALCRMERLGVGCIIILGGDGTSRLAAKAGIKVPIIPISTGTNNVYPEFWEGTTVGIAAGYIAGRQADEKIAPPSKVIEISINGVFREVALVDAALTRIPQIGSKIVPEIDSVTDVIVCKCAPELIGLSALIGCVAICNDADDFGYYLETGTQGTTVVTSMNSGCLTEVTYSVLQQIGCGEEITFRKDYGGTIALDGERSQMFHAGDVISMKITRNGPRKLNVRETLRRAVREKYFIKK